MMCAKSRITSHTRWRICKETSQPETVSKEVHRNSNKISSQGKGRGNIDFKPCSVVKLFYFACMIVDTTRVGFAIDG